MTIVSNARLTTFVNPMTDPKALVSCKDEFDIATMGTDFIFDALNPATYLGGTLPASSAAIPSAGITGIVVTNGGTGGTDGTYPLTITGGGGSGATGTFTVAGGTMTAITITNPGTGYTSNPSIGISGTGLSGVSLSPVLGSLLNLARDAQPALSRTLPVVLAPFSYSAKPTFDGKGLSFVNGSSVALSLNKVGLGGKACQPFHEGFLDFLEVTVFKATSWPTATAPYLVTGGSGGIQFTTSGIPQAGENGTAIGSAVPTGKIALAAKVVRFNVGANTSTITGFVGADGIIARTNGITGKAPTAYSTATTNSAVVGGSNGGASASINGSLYYLYREYLSVSARTDDDVAALLQRLYAAALTRYA